MTCLLRSCTVDAGSLTTDAGSTGPDDEQLNECGRRKQGGQEAIDAAELPNRRDAKQVGILGTTGPRAGT